MVEISFFEIYNEKIHDLLASVKEKGGKKATVCMLQYTTCLVAVCHVVLLLSRRRVARRLRSVCCNTQHVLWLRVMFYYFCQGEGWQEGYGLYAAIHNMSCGCVSCCITSVKEKGGKKATVSMLQYTTCLVAACHVVLLLSRRRVARRVRSVCCNTQHVLWLRVMLYYFSFMKAVAVNEDATSAHGLRSLDQSKWHL